MGDSDETDRPVVRRIVEPLEAFIRLEASSGLLLLGAAIAAVVWANLAPAGYENFWGTDLSFSVGGLNFDEDLRHWINDLLMAAFFFLIALEVKREVLLGDLADRRIAAVPIAAALGGMAVPAALFLLINSGGSGTPDGWAIPLATDVAFALALLAVIGRRAPGPLRAFLLTVAIADDVGTIAIIALVFTASLSLGWLGGAVGAGIAVYALRRLRVRTLAPYVLLAAVLWIALYQSGVHATLAGVALGLLTPARPLSPRDDESPLARMESAVHPWSAYLVLPLFALANAGVPLDAGALGDVFTTALGLGIVAGLLIGKPLGLLTGSWLAARLTPGRLPEDVTYPSLLALGEVAGIGFTVALFISELALPDESVPAAKVAILTASLLASIFGFLAFALRARRAT
jgi:NhaA family Na+:H+ antiporter